MDNFLPSLVEKMSNKLSPPHKHVVEQGQQFSREESELSYIGKGYCKVVVRDAKGKEIYVRRLDEGEHFGEVSIVYNCQRSASVISMNYNTFATINWEAYKRLIQEFPEYESCLMRHVVTTYYDHRIKFITNMLKRVEYLDLVPQDILFELMFALKEKKVDKEGIVLEQERLIESIYFIEEGQVKIETEFENNEFIIDKMGPGSVINSRAVFLRDQMYVNVTALTDVKILIMDLNDLMALV